MSILSEAIAEVVYGSSAVNSEPGKPNGSIENKKELEATRTGLFRLLNNLKMPISALAVTVGLGTMGMGAYRLHTGNTTQSELIANIETVTVNPEILTEISLLFFGSTSALLGLSMNLVDLRRRWTNNRIALLEREKEREKNEFLQELERYKAIEIALDKKLDELKKIRIQLEEEIRINLESIRSSQEKVDQLNTQLLERAREIDSLKSSIIALENELTILRTRMDRFERYEDATLCVQALEMASQMREMADVFLRASKFGVNINGQGPNGAYLFFGVNPDLTQNLAITRKDLEIMTAQWLGEGVPEDQRAYNKAVLIPLLEQFEGAENMMKQGLLENAYTTLLKLRGKIELLSEMNQNEGEEYTSPEMEWRNYAMHEKLPTEWLEDGGGQLINFFELLKVKPVSEWSEDFKNTVKSAFRKLSGEKHPDNPDTGVDANEFRKIILAKQVLENEKDFQKYFTAYQKFNTLFNN